MANAKIGTKVCIKRSARSNFRNRRKYPTGCGVLMESAKIGPSGGWDVYDVRLNTGRTTSAHGFEITKKRKK